MATVSSQYDNSIAILSSYCDQRGSRLFRPDEQYRSISLVWNECTSHRTEPPHVGCYTMSGFTECSPFAQSGHNVSVSCSWSVTKTSTNCGSLSSTSRREAG